jgi:serine/threonine protein kinase
MMCVQRMKIVHRDLKSANCLVDKHYSVKICDFGLSRILSGSSYCDDTAVGTPEWTAPELLRNEPVTDKCDVFSLGVIMWELSTLRRPWEGVLKASCCVCRRFQPICFNYLLWNQGVQCASWMNWSGATSLFPFLNLNLWWRIHKVFLHTLWIGPDGSTEDLHFTHWFQTEYSK